jgi:hypothetical protein
MIYSQHTARGSRQPAGAVRCTLVPSVGATSGASTCSQPPTPVLTCWSSGGGKSGSVASASGAGSASVDSSGVEGSGAGAAVTGPALEDSSRVTDPGAGLVLSIETHRRVTIGNTRSRDARGTAGGSRSLGQRPSDLAHTLAWSR